jgi:hypothetical protein
MCRRPVTILMMLSLLVTGCASSYRVVEIPQREADMYPVSQTRDGLTIAIDEMRGSARAQQYFGANLIRAGILPVAIIVSNRGEQRVAVKPSDILLQRGRDIVDPVPLQTVIAIAQDQRVFLRKRTRENVATFFRSIAFTETVLLPNETYQGVMFFSNPRPRRRDDRYFSVWSLFEPGGPRMRVAVTEMDSHDRMHFGPFSLAAPASGRSWAQWTGFERY